MSPTVYNPQYSAQYYSDNRDRILERRRKYLENNKDSIVAKRKVNYKENKEKFLAKMRVYYHSNREKILNHKSKWGKEYGGQKRLEVMNILGNKCNICGFTDLRVLQIDHINNNGNDEIRKLGGLARNSTRYYNHVRADIQNYQLLCANCNWIKELENRQRKTRYYKNQLMEVL